MRTCGQVTQGQFGGLLLPPVKNKAKTCKTDRQASQSFQKASIQSSVLFLLRVRVPPPAPWLDGESESLKSPCCRLAIHKKKTKPLNSNCLAYLTS
ncbi:hypothetical protein PoB_003324600 [Plakobranchus ocellatus]|uniref:Uncharacterized protein n=1 Tax=Plakobranchus ocellatus TaxID=259542 RepID=A0AAV4AEK9_9GAST|nr:hypothetical protein PoB_003324600 [Plakobranchus ocellatus]